MLVGLESDPHAEIAAAEVHAVLLILVGVTPVSVAAVVRAIAAVIVLLTVVVTAMIVATVVVTAAVVTPVVVTTVVMPAVPTCGHCWRGEQAAQRQGGNGNHGAEETFHRITSLNRVF